MSCSDSWCLKLVREISASSFRDFCSSFQSLAAENWKERRPKEELVLGVTREKQWGEQVFDTLMILQVFLLTKHVEFCHFYHRYTSTVRDGI